MIISAWECKCGMYNPKIATNLLRKQVGRDHRDSEVFFNIKSVKVVCRNPDCQTIKTVGVIGA